MIAVSHCSSTTQTHAHAMHMRCTSPPSKPQRDACCCAKPRRSPFEWRTVRVPDASLACHHASDTRNWRCTDRRPPCHTACLTMLCVLLTHTPRACAQAKRCIHQLAAWHCTDTHNAVRGLPLAATGPTQCRRDCCSNLATQLFTAQHGVQTQLLCVCVCMDAHARGTQLMQWRGHGTPVARTGAAAVVVRCCWQPLTMYKQFQRDCSCILPAETPAHARTACAASCAREPCVAQAAPACCLQHAAAGTTQCLAAAGTTQFDCAETQCTVQCTVSIGSSTHASHGPTSGRERSKACKRRVRGWPSTPHTHTLLLPGRSSLPQAMSAAQHCGTKTASSCAGCMCSCCALQHAHASRTGPGSRHTRGLCS
jgi:hypothetical protein